MTAHRDPERLIRTFLDDGPDELPDHSYDAVRAHIDQTRQRVVIGPWREPRMSNFARIGIAAAAVLAIAVIGVNILPKPDGFGGPVATPTPSPSPTVQPTATVSPSNAARTYETTPFAPTAEIGTICFDPPQPGCSESPEDDSIRVTYTFPDGWAIAPFNSIWLASEHNSGPAGAGVIALRGGWLHSDPCHTNPPPVPDIPTGTTVDDFANALAEHPLLEVTDPVDVTLAGYDGKYVDLQTPSDISGCRAYFPWEPAIFAQGPGHRWHLWILDVDGVRVVIQATDYAGTAPERQAELRAIVDSIVIEP